MGDDTASTKEPAWLTLRLFKTTFVALQQGRGVVGEAITRQAGKTEVTPLKAGRQVLHVRSISAILPYTLYYIVVSSGRDHHEG